MTSYLYQVYNHLKDFQHRHCVFQQENIAQERSGDVSKIDLFFGLPLTDRIAESRNMANRMDLPHEQLYEIFKPPKF